MFARDNCAKIPAFAGESTLRFTIVLRRFANTVAIVEEDLPAPLAKGKKHGSNFAIFFNEKQAGIQKTWTLPPKKFRTLAPHSHEKLFE